MKQSQAKERLYVRKRLAKHKLENAEHALIEVEFGGNLTTKIQAVSTAYNETEDPCQQSVSLKFFLERHLTMISWPSLTFHVCWKTEDQFYPGVCFMPSRIFVSTTYETRNCYIRASL